ncbi:unnamed protein product, partial [Medioppia subpectinata]
RVMEYVQLANLLWICPLQIGISIYLLWQELQYGSLAGLIVMLALLPVNAFIGARMRGQQIRLLKQRDQRTKLMSEILNGIKVLKLYAWETSFDQLIRKFRSLEMKNLRKQAYLSAGITFAFNSAPFFVAIASFSTYLMIDRSNVLDAQKVFVSQAIFNILRRPLAFFPQLITTTMMFFVSIRRINKFINCDELKDQSPSIGGNQSKDHQNNGKANGVANGMANGMSNGKSKSDSQIVLSNASFKWDSDETTPSLSNISLD